MNRDKTREETQSNFSLQWTSPKMNEWKEFDKASDALLSTEAYSASVLASSMNRVKEIDSWSSQGQYFKNPHHSKELLGIPTSVKIKPLPNHSLRMNDVQTARRNSASHLYNTIRDGVPRARTTGIGPFGSQFNSFQNPQGKSSVQKDVYYDIHMLQPLKLEQSSHCVCPDVGKVTESDDSLQFSTKPVINLIPVEHDDVAPELMEVMKFIKDASVREDPLVPSRDNRQKYRNST